MAAELRGLGLHVEVHADHFPEANTKPEESDADWIQDVTGRGWVIFTRNGNIRNNPLERRTFINSGARVFNIRNAGASAPEVAKCIERAKKRIEGILAIVSRGVVYERLSTRVGPQPVMTAERR